jgi:hypothetical protein
LSSVHLELGARARECRTAVLADIRTQAGWRSRRMPRQRSSLTTADLEVASSSTEGMRPLIGFHRAQMLRLLRCVTLHMLDPWISPRSRPQGDAGGTSEGSAKTR